MRVQADDDLRSLMEETLKTAKAAKSAAEHTRILLFWMHVASWLKTAVFLILAVTVIVLGWRAYSKVQGMAKEFNAQAAVRDAAPLFMGTDSSAQ